MELVEENYFSEAARKFYTGSSELKSFMDCEARTLAEINGEWKEEPSKALLVGSYVDAAVSETLDIFKAQHPELYTQKGTLKAEFQQADYIVERINRDELFKKYISGDHQTIMTAAYNTNTNTWYTEKEAMSLTHVDNNIIYVKIKIDSYFPNKAIVDLKCISNFQPLWNEKTKEKENFIDYWKYTLQGALYQKVVEVNTGKKLPFFIAACTKESEPDIAILSIDQETLDNQLNIIEQILPRVNALKTGQEQPIRCNHCNYCRFTKKLTHIIDYKFLGEEE
jgi:hypothetical protein